MIQRYKLLDHPTEMTKSDEGEWVKFADYADMLRVMEAYRNFALDWERREVAANAVRSAD